MWGGGGDALRLAVVEQVARLDGLDTPQRADGHEDRRLDGAVVGLQASGAGVRFRVAMFEGEAHGVDRAAAYARLGNQGGSTKPRLYAVTSDQRRS